VLQVENLHISQLDCLRLGVTSDKNPIRGRYDIGDIVIPLASDGVDPLANAIRSRELGEKAV
jgi:hypothetical protein